MLSVIVDPRAFDAPNAEQEADAFVDWLRTSRLAQGVDGVLAPGEPELARRAERSEHGTPIDAASWAQITEAAREVGMTEERIAEMTGTDASLVGADEVSPTIGAALVASVCPLRWPVLGFASLSANLRMRVHPALRDLAELFFGRVRLELSLRYATSM
jgi:hypothetical protein